MSWRTTEYLLEKELEVYDAELHGACRALEIAQNLENDGRVTLFLDSQAAIKRLRHVEPGPGQELAIRTQEAARRLQMQGVEVTVQ